MAYELTVESSGKTLSIFNDGIYEGAGLAAPVELDIDVDGSVKRIVSNEVSLSDYVTKSELAAAVAPVRVVRWVGNGQPSRSFALPCVPGVIRFFLTSGVERFFIAGVGVYFMDSDSGVWLIDDDVYGKLSLVNNLLTVQAGTGTSFNAYNVLGRVVVAVIYPLDIIEVLL